MVPRRESIRPPRPTVGERRAEPREPVAGCLWMIDSQSSTILRCRCVEVSQNGMRLRVPAGYGVRVGQRYQLTSHLPGQSAPPGMGLTLSRRAEVIRMRSLQSDDEYDTEVGVALSPSRAPAAASADPAMTPAWS